MTSFANVEAIGLLVKKETTYGTYATPSNTTDGVQLADIPTDEEGYLYGGPRAPQQAGLNMLQEVAKNGRYLDLGNILLEVKGAGAAYSASVKPNQNISALLQASGFDETVTTTPGSEKVEYAPTAPTGTMASVSAEYYTRGEKWPLAGMYLTHALRFRDGGPALWEFKGRGLVNAQASNVALPAVTYAQATVLPPVANAINFVAGSYLVGVVRELEWDIGREFDTPRVNLNAASGIAGFMWGPFKPSLKVTLESTTLPGTPFSSVAGIDPYQLFSSAQNIACGFQVGSVLYNRLKVIFPNGCYFTAPPKKSRNGSSALWELELAPRGVTPTDMGWLKYSYD